MGDMGDYWRERDEYLKSKGISRSRPYQRVDKVKFRKRHEAAGFRQCTEWHWQTKIGTDLLDYWPSKQKWRFKDETRMGTEAQLFAFIESVKSFSGEVRQRT